MGCFVCKVMEGLAPRAKVTVHFTSLSPSSLFSKVRRIIHQEVLRCQLNTLGHPSLITHMERLKL